MGRKQRWIGFGFLLLLIGGYWVYQRFNTSVQSPWELIPSDAHLVLESTTLQDTVAKSAQFNEMMLRNTPIFQEAIQGVDQLIWASLDTADALSFLRKKAIWYSLHTTSKDRMAFIFYIPLRSSADRVFVNRLQNPNADRFRVMSHPYEGQRVYEMLTVQNVSLGSFIVSDDYLVGSSSTILLESVVRRIKQPFETPLQRADLSLVRPNTIAGMYVRSSVLSAIFSSSKDESVDWQTRYVKAFFPNELKTYFRQSPSRTHLVGLSTDEVGSKSALAYLFAGQTPTRISCGSLIPSQTSTFYHIGISDGRRFGKALTSFINDKDDPFIQAGRRKLRPLLQNQENGFYKYLGNEIALLRLDAPTTDRRLVMLIRSSSIERFVDRFQLAALLSNGVEKFPGVKPFLQYKITFVDAPELPAYLFGGLFRGFEQSWMSQIGDYLIIANTESVLQEYLQSIDQRSVWTESHRQRDFLSQTLRSANFTAYTRFSRAGGSVADRWPVAWRQFLNHPETALENVENLVYQSSYGREHIYSSLILGRATRRASEAVFNRVFLQKKIELTAAPTCAPLVVGDFISGTGQLWVIDNERQFMVVTPENEKKVIKLIDGPVQSRLVPVDFLNNGRLQYAFTTDRSLYIADPVNGLVKLQSIPLPDGVNPALLLSPHRDQNRNLVLLMVHRDGSIYAYDRRLQRFNRQFVMPAGGESTGAFRAIVRNHVLSVVSLQKEGKLLFWYENGTQANGFPVELKAEFVSPAWLDASGLGTLTAMSRQGELIRLSEDGQIKERTQLYRPIRRGSFRLLPDITQSDFVLLRTTDTEVAILDKQGKQLFQVRNLVPGRTVIRYHILGAGIQVISIKSGNFTALYDLKGHPIGDRAISSLYPVELYFSVTNNKLFVYASTEKAIQISSIKLQ